MFAPTMQVATKIPVELVNTIDRQTALTLSSRSTWFRNAILKQAEAEGLIRVNFDHAGKIYDLALGEVVA